MSKSKIKFLDTYLPILEANHSAEQTRLFEDEEYKKELNERLLNGEIVDPSAFGAKTYIGKSGRSTGKTTNTEFVIGKMITEGDGDIWYCRSEEGDIGKSIFSSMVATLRIMGFTLSKNKRSDFRVCQSPYQITHNRTGNVIQFFPLNKDINRTKGFYPPSGKLQMVVVEEANEVDDGKYITALETTANKYINSSSKFVYNLNPPETRQHWSVKYFDDKIKYGATLLYTTWEHLARNNLLSAAMIAEILKMKRNNPLFYRYWYLGEIVNMSGLVFPQFEREKHVITAIDRNKVANITSRYFVAGDAANKNDPTCFGLWCELKYGSSVGALLCVDAMYYDPRKHGQLDDVELAQKVCDWFNAAIAKYKLQCHKGYGTVDNANWNLMRMLQRSDALGHIQWQAATNKSIMRDINRVRVLLREGMLLFHEAADNQVGEIIREFESFVYDEKTGEIKKNQDDHGIDMTKYATFFVYRDTKQFF